MEENKNIRDVEIEQAEAIEVLKQALSEEKNKAEKYLTGWQRAQADLENSGKRAEQERLEIVESANRTFVLDLLPILDDFGRAFASLPAPLVNSSWTEGAKLIYNKLKMVLAAQGLIEIKAEGEYFDPYIHEAAGQQEGKQGMVIAEVRKGYKFRDRLLRPSMVIVGKESKTQQEKEE